MVIVAASFARLTLIAAEKHMFLIMTHGANQIQKQFNSLYSMPELGTEPLYEKAEITERGEWPQFSNNPRQTGKIEQMPVMPTEQRQRGLGIAPVQMRDEYTCGEGKSAQQDNATQCQQQ